MSYNREGKGKESKSKGRKVIRTQIESLVIIAGDHWLRIILIYLVACDNIINIY